MKLKDNDEPSGVRDNRRRGPPIAGCDCEWCFGYCVVDWDQHYRERREANYQARRLRNEQDI